METANGNNDNNLATTPLIHSDDVPEMHGNWYITLDEITVIVTLCLLLTAVNRFIRKSF
jgi:hypothetical protein